MTYFLIVVLLVLLTTLTIAGVYQNLMYRALLARVVAVERHIDSLEDRYTTELVEKRFVDDGEIAPDDDTYTIPSREIPREKNSKGVLIAREVKPGQSVTFGIVGDEPPGE